MTTTRAELLDALAAICALRPSVRFGQLLSNLASLAELRPEAAWIVDDERLLNEAREELASLRARRPDPSAPGRAELFAALGRLASDADADRLGEAVAGLVAGPGPSTPTERAGRLWEVEDEELLDALHARLGTGRLVGH